MIKRGVVSALLLAACAHGFIFPSVGRAASKAPAARGQCSTGFGEHVVAVQPLRMSASTAEPEAAKGKETFEFQAEVSRYVRV